MAHRLTILVLWAALLAATPARAQQREPGAEAMELFRRSATAYRDGDFEEAATLLRRAYEIEPVPVLQYNLARALEGLGDLPGAVAAYEAYLEGEPDARDRGSIEARLATLREQIAEREALARAAEARAAEEEAARTASEPPRTTPEPVPERGGPSAAPWIVAAVGVAGVGVAIGLGAVAQDTNAAAMEEPVHERRVELVDEAQTYALAANVAFGVGGALALAGLVWGIVDVASIGGRSEDAAVAIGPGGVLVRGAF